MVWLVVAPPLWSPGTISSEVTGVLSLSLPPLDIPAPPEADAARTDVNDRLRKVRILAQVRGDAAWVRESKDRCHIGGTHKLISIDLRSHSGVPVLRGSFQVRSGPPPADIRQVGRAFASSSMSRGGLEESDRTSPGFMASNTLSISVHACSVSGNGASSDAQPNSTPRGS